MRRGFCPHRHPDNVEPGGEPVCLQRQRRYARRGDLDLGEHASPEHVEHLRLDFRGRADPHVRNTGMKEQKANLTLRLDRTLINAATRYAAQHGVSVSRLVSNYFETLAWSSLRADDDWKAGLPEAVRLLIDCEPPREHVEVDYRRHLDEKHNHHLHAPG